MPYSILSSKFLVNFNFSLNVLKNILQQNFSNFNKVLYNAAIFYRINAVLLTDHLYRNLRFYKIFINLKIKKNTVLGVKFV